MHVDDGAVARTLETYGTFAASERLLMELVKAGADRQAMHEVIRSHSMAAWAAVTERGPNPLPDRLSADPEVTAAMFEILETQRILEGEGQLTLVPPHSELLNQLLVARKAE